MATNDTATNAVIVARGKRVAVPNRFVATPSSLEIAVLGSAARQDSPAVQIITDAKYAAIMPTPPNQPSVCTTGNPEVVRAIKPAAVVTDVSRQGPITAASPFMTRSS
jgi:hypothetical protein